AIVFCAPVSLKSQEQKPKEDPDEVIRVDTNLVQLRTVVTDRNGRAVDNLPQDDFEVLENGRPQKISFFSLERVGGTTGSPQQRPDQTKAENGVQRLKTKNPSRSI